jgi:hypothetical protein
MTKTRRRLSILLALPALALALAGIPGAVLAQTATGSAPAAEPAAPPAAAPTPVASDARKACTDAMNADPQFAAAVVKIADEKAAKQRDDDLIAAHTAANMHVQKNERHVVYAYAAMWIVAAAFVIFLWRRQEVLKGEITNLRRDLEAAADDSKLAKDRA